MPSLPTGRAPTDPARPHELVVCLQGDRFDYRAAGLADRGSIYLTVESRRGSTPLIYVGKARHISKRLSGHKRLLGLRSTTSVLVLKAPVTLSADDIAVLERLVFLVADRGAEGELANCVVPGHGRVSQGRYEQLRGIVLEMFKEIERKSLLAFRRPVTEILAERVSAEWGYFGALPEADLDGGTAHTNLTAGRRSYAKRLREGRWVIERGSEVKAGWTDSTPALVRALRQELKSRKLLAPTRPGVERLLCDLTFEFPSEAIWFLTRLKAAPVSFWTDVQPVNGEARPVLEWWRVRAPDALGATDAQVIRHALKAQSLVLFAPTWRAALNGDEAAASNLAICFCRKGAAVHLMDVVMSALFAVAIENKGGARGVFACLRRLMVQRKLVAAGDR